MSKYTIISEIGRGGFGVVHEIQDENGVSFAKKTFRPAAWVPASSHDRLRTRFKREVKTQIELGGNEIIPVLDYDLNTNTPWFVMPLAEKTYFNQIEEDRIAGRVDIDAIADILNGLERLHELGYVHRDLNPKNILLDDSHWKLSDLGAVLPPKGQTVTLTEGTTIFTEHYCAPEQRNDFHRARPSADIYSLGCILHDIYGTQPRTPYLKHTATGPIGPIIEKCTETNQAKRPTIKILRGILLDALVDVGGYYNVDDQQSSDWLERIKSIADWDDKDFDEFVRFFIELDIEEREEGHKSDYVYSLSTPFLTRLSVDAILKIVERDDGISDAIIDKYCEWAKMTSFLFAFADNVCLRLVTIFDNSGPANKAMAMAALIELGASHNRYYVMRKLLFRCGKDQVKKEIARRISIEIKTEEIEQSFRDCVTTLDWDISTLAPVLAKFCE